MKYKFYWVGQGTTGNFGDVLTPKLLDYFKIEYEFTRKGDYNAICIGSILRHAKPGTIVLGSGFLSKPNPVCIDADIRFIRGPQSRKKFISAGGNCPEIYGDPALLLPLFCDESKKEHDIGIIPHISHYNRIKNEYPNEHIINLATNNALQVAKEITKCRKIISGSLHGIIAAHAYNIPAAWVPMGGIKGDGIKFNDHYESIGLNAIPSTLDTPKFTIPKKINLNSIIEIFEGLK